MSRAERLLSLLELLRAHRQPVTAQRLAQATQVSVRTLYRDIDSLRTQGADIVGDPGLGYLLRPGFTLPPLMFSADELEALSLGARWVSLQGDAQLAQAAQAAMAKVAASLPAEMRLALDTMGLLVPQPQPQVPVEPWQPALREAIRSQRKLRLHYSDAQGQVSERVVWPVAMAFFQSSRVLTAWCELRADFRHFRADRVQALEALPQRYPVLRHVLLAQWRAQLEAEAARQSAAGEPCVAWQL